MVWPFSSSSSAPKPALTPEGTPHAPDRTARDKCWEHRDVYFACLDKNSIVDAIREKGEAGKKCGGEHKSFEENCASSWVKYFKQRRVAEYQKEKTLQKLRKEGATEIPGSVGPMPGTALR